MDSLHKLATATLHDVHRTNMLSSRADVTKLQLTSVQFVALQSGSALQASSIQDDALLVVSKHVACCEALHKAVLSTAIPFADLAVDLQRAFMSNPFDIPFDAQMGGCWASAVDWASQVGLLKLCA